MTKQEIDLKIAALRRASKELKKDRRGRYLNDLEKYATALKEKYGVSDDD